MVVNDGPSLRPEEASRLFEPFYTRKPGHAGMGLTISHNAVQQHGGTLTVQNLTIDRGVVATLKLPTASAMAAI